jgi:hypothetical protein
MAICEILTKVGWRNGNALVSGARDSGFESQAYRFHTMIFIFIFRFAHCTTRTSKAQTSHFGRQFEFIAYTHP